ncbi:MAG TPA: response regulator [Acidobacteriota bacterium]|nr:response regulator [Acidobacteriota bacterium]
MSIKILVADDSVTIQKMIRLAFSDEKAAVVSTSDGDSALELLRTFRPDIVLADVCMPGPNGYEICEKIKDDPEFRGIPVLLLAGAFEPYDEQEAVRVRCDGHLTKPFDTTELIEIVNSLAGKNNPSDPGTKTSDRSSQSLSLSAAVKIGMSCAGRKSSIEPRVWDSFTGSDQILELFDRETLAAARGMPVAVSEAGKPPTGGESAGTSVEDDVEISLSDELLERIADMVVRRMSTDVIREVAWKVVPELSEALVRRVVDEQHRS